MYSGWIVKWPINRKLTPQEKADALPRARQPDTAPDEQGALIGFNSTYAEFADRRFILRGWIGTFVPLILFISMPVLPIIFLISLPLDIENVIGTAIIGIAVIIGMLLFWHLILSKDFFTHTYYPIRFNRKTRQIYVYREKRDGGIVTIPWEKGFFHTGHGLRDKQFLDLRCHVLEGDVVRDTFVTGMLYRRKEAVQQLWEFIRRYMDEDIESLGTVEVWTSTAPTWKNCEIMVGVLFGGLFGLGALLWPLALPIMLTRWLVLKSCKPPVWPPEIEAACRIDPDDPHHLPEPAYIGQFAVERERAKAKQAP